MSESTVIGQADIQGENPADNPATREEFGIRNDSGGNDPFITLRDSLPENYREHPAITRHENLESLAKEYLNQSTLIGRKGVILPKEGDPDDQSRFYEALGRPASPEDYKLPEGMERPETVDEGFTMRMIQQMHEAGLTQQQFEKIMPAYLQEAETAQQQFEAQNQAHTQEALAALESEFGQTMQPKMNLAERAIEHLFGDNAETILNARGPDGRLLGNNPNFIKALMQVGEQFGEDTLTGGTGGQATQTPGAMTPDEAVKERDRLMADSEFTQMLWDAKHPGHDAAVKKLDEVYYYMQGQGALSQVEVGMPGGARGTR